METHWQTIESMLAFVTFLDNKLQWQIDVAPVHIAYAFRSALPKHIHPCYVNPGSTSVAHPADTGVMKPVKGALAIVCGNFFASTLLDTIRASGSVVLSDSLAQNRDHMPVWVNEAVLALQSREKIHFNSCGGTLWTMTPPRCWARPDNTWRRAHFSAAANVDHFEKETCKARRRTRVPLPS